ncbi:IS701 family transposase ISBsm1 [Geobacillus icigianus]|uniref:IS701 family transposase ISBsm1 n=1 Tax=Geobacillus icigianus TaxID=1430331 RepID=A0ABU6BGF6_9BACL|nr:IS701 family transposase ISBsm1 [Geobacillus icigianus]
MYVWYPFQMPREACLKQGFHVIAMLKTNRILYPKGIAVQAKEFARYIAPNDTRLVTVGNELDRVYRYEGALNGLDDAVVLLAWKADQPMTPDHFHVVFDTNRELGDEDILLDDAQHWTIRQAKDWLKSGATRVRHVRTVKRDGAVVLFSCVSSIAESQQDLSSGLELLLSWKGHSLVEFICNTADQDIPINVIKKQLHVA